MLRFVNENTVINNASTLTATDGSFSVFALDDSVITPIEYNLGSDFTFNESTTALKISQGSAATFTGLATGKYTVYARSSSTSVRTLSVTVGVGVTYNERYRLEFDSETGQDSFLVEIEQANYNGSVTEVCGGETPVLINWLGEGSQDVFTPVVSSKLELTLISPTDFYYQDLFTTNEKEFRISVYKNGVDLIWRGFLLPMLYSEPYYTKTNYEVKFVFTDGIADLAKETFSDDSGNLFENRISFFDAIKACLNKTQIGLEIWESINIVHGDLNIGDSDSFLKQVYFDPRLYVEKNENTCLQVLNKLLSNLKSRLYQDSGRWNLELITAKSASEILTRCYESDGTFIETLTLEPRLLLRKPDAVSPKISLRERSGIFNILETYGTYLQTYDLSIEEPNNIIENGGFEDFDTTQILFWDVATQDVVGPQGTNSWEYGLEKLIEPRGDSEYAFYTRFASLGFGAGTQNQKIILSSDNFQLNFPNTGEFLIKIKFDVYSRPFFTGPYIYLDFALYESPTVFSAPYRLQSNEVSRDSSAYSIVNQSSNELVENKYIRVYIDEDLTWKTFEIDLIISNAIQCNRPYKIEFRVSSNPIYDIDTIASLRSVVTTSKSIRTFNNRIRVRSDDALLIYYYKLEAGQDADDSPNVIRPNGYGSGNFYVWKLQETYPIPTVTDEIGITLSVAEWLQSLLIDNVTLSYFPQRALPIETVEKEETIRANVRQTLEEIIYHGGLPTVDLLDSNYTFISKGWLSNSAGNLLDGKFYVRGTVADLELPTLLRSIVKSHYSQNRILLAGDYETRDGIFTFYNTVYEVRSGRIFTPISLMCDLKNNYSQADLIEILRGEAIIDEGNPPLPGDPGGPDPIEPEPYTREHTTEFSNEFS